MQGLYVPPQSAFPVPAPFPTPSPDPNTYGLTIPQAFSPMASYLPPGVQPETAPSFGGTLLERMNTALTGTPEGVTEGMPLPEAQAQTDKALARIAQVNPELAQQLSAQRGEEQDQGFWGGLLHAVASSPIGKALEFISRPARIIPEILTDTDDSVWNNIGDALSGRSTATMGDFLAKYNILQGDDLLSKVARGVSSFALDVAVDPLTYLTMGLGAVGRAGAQRLGAKVVMEASLMKEAGVAALDDLAKTVGKTALGVADDATEEVVRSAAFNHLWKSITEQQTSLFAKGRWGRLAEDLTESHIDMAGGYLGEALKGAHRETVLAAINAADEGAKVIGKFGLTRMGPKMAEHLNIPIEQVETILKGMKKAGHFASRQEYMQAKYAGALLGGWRLSVPGIRIITPAMWGTKNLDFSIMRRFMSGLSGQHRLMRAVERGVIPPELAKEALEHATQGGWKQLRDRMPQVAKEFGGPVGTLGSAFAQASWQVGSITRNMGSAALVRGGGLGTMLAADARKTVRTVRSSLQREAMQLAAGDEYAPTMWEELHTMGFAKDEIGGVRKTKAGTMSQVEVQRTMHSLDRATVEKLGSDDEAALTIIRILEAFPTEEAQMMGADRWFESVRRSIMGQGLEDEELAARLVRLDRQREIAKRVEDSVKDIPEAQMAARLYRTVSKHTRDSYNQLGGHAADSTIRTQSEAVINPRNRADVETGHAVHHGKTYVPTAEPEGEYVPGFGAQDVTDTPWGRGIELEEVVDDPTLEGQPRYGTVEGRTTATLPDQDVQNAIPGSVDGDEEGFLYHLSSPEVFDAIAEEGIKPMTSAAGKMIPPEMRIERAFFADSLDRAKQLAVSPEGGEHVAFRVKAEAAGDLTAERSFSGSYFGTKKVEPGDIEYMAPDGSWKPVGRAEPLDGARVSPGKTQRASDGTLRDLDDNIINPEDYVIVYHATDQETADRILKEGFVPGAKKQKEPEVITDPIVAKMLKKEVGDTIDYMPGRGSGGGVYVSPNPEYVRGVFGEVVLEVRVKAKDIGTAPERMASGRVNAQRSLVLDDGYIEGAIGSGDVRVFQGQGIRDVPPRPEAGARKQKQAVVAMKNPAIINMDAAAQRAAGKKPLTDGALLDVNEEADEFVANAMAMLEEPWQEGIEQLRYTKEWHKGDGKKYHELAKKILRDMGLDPGSMTDEMMDISIETQTTIAARLKTAFLKKRGHDGVVIIENGKQRAIVFEDGFLTGDSAPVWELSDDAPVYRPEEGYYHRRMESWVHEALEGTSTQTEKRAPRDWDAHFSRLTAGMSFEEAETAVRKTLREMGLTVDDTVAVMDRDISRNLNAYVDGMADDMGNVFLGREARRIQSMGLTRSPFASDFIGPKYESVPTTAYMNTGKWMSKHGEKLVKLTEKVARHQTRVAKKAVKEMELTGKVIAELNERLFKAQEDEMAKTLRALAGMGQGNRPVGKEFMQRMQDATTPQELRKVLRELEGRKPKTEVIEAIKGKAAELVEPENLRPGVFEQIQNRSRDIERLRQKADWRLNTMKDVSEEWNRIMFGAQARMAEPKVALQFGDVNQTGMSKILVPGLEGMNMPATMADEFNFAARGFKHLNEFQKVWRRFTSFWKEWATWAWPGFHVRNMIGGWFNNWLGGVEFQDYVEVWRAMRARREVETGVAAKWSARKLDKAFLKKHGLADYYFGFEPTYADLATLFTNNGINSASGRSFGEARIGAELLDREMAKPANSPWTLLDTVARKNTKAGLPGRKVAQGLRGTGEMTENLLRGSAFLQGLKQHNGDFMASHAFTMMRHGDYGDLTDWEYGLIRDVVPFYKWMRTNTPLQIHNLFESPGKLLGVMHAKEAIFTGMGIDYDEAKGKMPEWAMEGFSFPAPGSSDEAINLVTADLPMNDLFMGAGEFFSSMLPLARPFLENYVTEKSLFTGAPITGKPVKVGWMGGIPALPGLLQGMGIGNVGPDGEYYIDDKMQNVLGVVPVISRFRNWVYEEPGRAKLRAGTLISAVVGISPRTFTEGEFADKEINFYYDQVLPTMEYLKGIGYPLPTTEDLNAMYGSTNNVLAAAGLTPRAGE